jgi:hypothetical protein
VGLILYSQQSALLLVVVVATLATAEMEMVVPEVQAVVEAHILLALR